MPIFDTENIIAYTNLNGEAVYCIKCIEEDKNVDMSELKPLGDIKSDKTITCDTCNTIITQT